MPESRQLQGSDNESKIGDESAQTATNATPAPRRRGSARSAHPDRILRAMTSTSWAIQPEKLFGIIELVTMHATGWRAADDQIRRYKAVAPEARTAPGAVAVIPLFGSISQRMSIMTDFSGSTSTEKFAAQFDQALKDSSVSQILIDVDSPGGTIYGVEELSTKIFEARGQKPILAHANALMASAAYWIASAADEIIVTPSGEVGSVGVYAAHVDESGLAENMGVKVTLISAGRYKVEGNPHEALSEEARGAMQARVDEYYDTFVSAVARNRGVGVADVRDGYGEGRVVGARTALRLGMVDRIEPFDATLARLGVSNVRSSEAMSMDMRQRRARMALALAS